MEGKIVEEPIATHYHNIPLSQLYTTTNRVARVIASVFRHGELEGEVETMLLLHELEYADQFLILSYNHQTAI